MRGLLEYAYLNKDKIKSMVAAEREKLINPAQPMRKYQFNQRIPGTGRNLKSLFILIIPEKIRFSL